MSDKNFDPLVERMQTRIYAGAKGRLRLALLQHQLEQLPLRLGPGLRVLDCGVGQGHLACALAARGAAVAGIDISAAMLQGARELAAQRGVELTLTQASIEQFDSGDSEPYGLVCCHAVVEWSEDPEANIAAMARLVKSCGFLSLMFYNPEALVMRNLLKGNFYRARRVDEPGQGGGLTPHHMLRLAEVERCCADAGLAVVARFGVRMVHDYLSPEVLKARDWEDLLEMETWLCDREPHWRLGRYIHLILQAA